MSNSYNNSQSQSRQYDNNPSGNNPRGGFRGGRGLGKREGGGFHIRLSDNEMRSARSIQEAFQLRSVVAVLGFALRTTAQLLEEGKLEEILNKHREYSQNELNQSPKGRNRGRAYSENESLNQQISDKPNPFARPEKPNNYSDEIEGNIIQEDPKASEEESAIKSNDEENINEEI